MKENSVVPFLWTNFAPIEPNKRIKQINTAHVFVVDWNDLWAWNECFFFLGFLTHLLTFPTGWAPTKVDKSVTGLLSNQRTTDIFTLPATATFSAWAPRPRFLSSASLGNSLAACWFSLFQQRGYLFWQVLPVNQVSWNYCQRKLWNFHCRKCTVKGVQLHFHLHHSLSLLLSTDCLVYPSKPPCHRHNHLHQTRQTLCIPIHGFFFGRYCFRLWCPLKGTICSSMLRFFLKRNRREFATKQIDKRTQLVQPVIGAICIVHKVKKALKFGKNLECHDIYNLMDSKLIWPITLAVGQSDQWHKKANSKKSLNISIGDLKWIFRTLSKWIQCCLLCNERQNFIRQKIQKKTEGESANREHFGADIHCQKIQKTHHQKTKCHFSRHNAFAAQLSVARCWASSRISAL